jgi:hypothetical protein
MALTKIEPDKSIADQIGYHFRGAANTTQRTKHRKWWKPSLRSLKKPLNPVKMS